MSRRAHHLWAAAALLAVAIAPYARTLDVPFYLDDFANIRDNAHVRMTDLGPVSLARAAFSSPSPRPVANLSFALNYWLGGYSVAGYHAVNIAIHAVNGLLVYLLALVTYRLAAGARADWRREQLAALLAAGLWVAHPIQTQAVTYVVQRMTSLSTGFYLLAVLLCVLGRTREGWARHALWVAGLASWALGLGSKPIAATLPVILFLYEWFFFRDASVAWLRRNLVWLGAGVAVMVALGWLYLGSDPLGRLGQSYGHRDFGPWERVLTQGRVLWLYLGLIFAPLPGRQNLLHAIEPSRSLFDPMSTAVAWLGLLALGGTALVARRRDRVIAFGVLWFFAQLAIESSFLSLELVFEHRLYLPLFGLALAAGWGVLRLPARIPALGVGRAAALGAVIVMALAASTGVRNELWRDPVRFYEDVVAKSPDRARARTYLGLALYRQGRVAESAEVFRRAIELEPDYPQGYGNLGMALSTLGDHAGAEAEYREAIRRSPGFARAHNNLGLALVAQGRNAEAHASFREAVRVDPTYANAHNNLGMSFVQFGQLDAAIEQFGEALRLDPASQEARVNLEDALRRR